VHLVMTFLAPEIAGLSRPFARMRRHGSPLAA
jgi:hypothetical protein